jgi:hypothetical protein
MESVKVAGVLVEVEYARHPQCILFLLVGFVLEGVARQDALETRLEGSRPSVILHQEPATARFADLVLLISSKREVVESFRDLSLP